MPPPNDGGGRVHTLMDTADTFLEYFVTMSVGKP
jgi:hypothetical protein